MSRMMGQVGVSARSGARVLGALVLLGAACSRSQTLIDKDTGSDAGISSPVSDPGAVQPHVDAGKPRPSQKLVILHTNDLHSHLMGFGPERDYTPASLNDDGTHGGIARLATAIGRARAGAEAAGTPVLLLDAGDFMMGTLFELLGTQAVPELTLMQALGYDATTLGNHEFDWTTAGLAAVLQRAKAQQITLPILSSNMHFSADPGDDALEALGPLPTKLIKTVGGLKVGFFGLLGSNAVLVAPGARPLSFDPISVAAARMVAELRDVDQVDLVIALSHSGIDHEGKGEDADLAASVPGIDVIISGHTHDTLSQPAHVGQTTIVTAGSYSAYLGELSITVTPPSAPGGAADVRVDDYTLLDIDDTIPGDAATQQAVEQYISAIDAAALTPQGLAYRQVVAQTAFDLPMPDASESALGDLITDAYLAMANTLDPSHPPALAVEANGDIRSAINQGATGELWFSDLFSVLPIGIGPDQIPGYSLVTYYLNARDIQIGMELDGAPELAGSDAFLQVSGVKAEYDLTRPPLRRVTRLALTSGGSEQVLDTADTTHCYRVVSSSYVAGLLGLIGSTTGGLISVTPKDADCVTPIDPTNRFVDANPATPAIEELKTWQALYGYVSRLPDANADNIPDIPSVYSAVQGRIVR